MRFNKRREKEREEIRNGRKRKNFFKYESSIRVEYSEATVKASHKSSLSFLLKSIFFFFFFLSQCAKRKRKERKRERDL